MCPTKQRVLKALTMNILHGLFVAGCLMILVPGSEEIEEESPIQARGETPTCPRGSPSYDLMQYAFPMYCVKESEACNLSPVVVRETYFYTGIISCRNKDYIIVVFRDKAYGFKRFVLDTLTVGKSSITSSKLDSSVFPVHRGYSLGPLIYYKMEDKSCYKVSYKLLTKPEIEYDQVLDEATSSDTCKAVKAGLKKFVKKDTSSNWRFRHVCCIIDEGPEKVDCAEIQSLQVIPRP